jgi:hypothetical protein
VEKLNVCPGDQDQAQLVALGALYTAINDNLKKRFVSCGQFVKE